jgi:hypothetical protein
VEFLATSGGNGQLETELLTDLGASVKCGVLVNCEFTSASPIFSVTGGANALVGANSISFARSGPICPSTSTWTATYSLSAPPARLFLASS